MKTGCFVKLQRNMFYAVIHATVFFGSRIVTLQWTLGIPHPLPLNRLGLTSHRARTFLYLSWDESTWWLNYTENVVDHRRATCNETFCALLSFEEQRNDEMWIYLRVTALCFLPLCFYLKQKQTGWAPQPARMLCAKMEIEMWCNEVMKAKQHLYVPISSFSPEQLNCTNKKNKQSTVVFFLFSAFKNLKVQWVKFAFICGFYVGKNLRHSP